MWVSLKQCIHCRYMTTDCFTLENKERGKGVIDKKSWQSASASTKLGRAAPQDPPATI